MKLTFATIAITASLILGIQSTDVPQGGEKKEAELPKQEEKEKPPEFTFRYKEQGEKKITGDKKVKDLLDLFNIKVACQDGNQVAEEDVIGNVWKETKEPIELRHQELHLYVQTQGEIEQEEILACSKSNATQILKLAKHEDYEIKDS